MSEPIFAAVERELGYGAQNALRDAERLPQRAAGFAAHIPGPPAATIRLETPLEAPVSALADVETKIKDFAADFVRRNSKTSSPPHHPSSTTAPKHSHASPSRKSSSSWSNSRSHSTPRSKKSSPA